jgi:hypothetical protein
MGQRVTVYSLDEVTWSTNPDEPLLLLSRQEDGRLQLQAKVQAVPREKSPVVARGDSLNGLGDDEPFVEEEEDVELKEDEIDDIEIDDIDLDDDDELLPKVPTKGKIAPSGLQKSVSRELVKQQAKKVSVVSSPPAKTPVAPSEESIPVKQKKVPAKESAPKVNKSKELKTTQADSKTPLKNKIAEKKITPLKVVPAAQVPKAKAAKGKAEQNMSRTKPAKRSSSSAKKIEAPQKGKAVKVKVSPSKGKSPRKKG